MYISNAGLQRDCAANRSYNLWKDKGNLLRVRPDRYVLIASMLLRNLSNTTRTVTMSICDRPKWNHDVFNECLQEVSRTVPSFSVFIQWSHHKQESIRSSKQQAPSVQHLQQFSMPWSHTTARNSRSALSKHCSLIANFSHRKWQDIYDEAVALASSGRHGTAVRDAAVPGTELPIVDVVFRNIRRKSAWPSQRSLVRSRLVSAPSGSRMGVRDINWIVEWKWSAFSTQNLEANGAQCLLWKLICPELTLLYAFVNRWS